MTITRNTAHRRPWAFGAMLWKTSCVCQTFPLGLVMFGRDARDLAEHRAVQTCVFERFAATRLPFLSFVANDATTCVRSSFLQRRCSFLNAVPSLLADAAQMHPLLHRSLRRRLHVLEAPPWHTW